MGTATAVSTLVCKGGRDLALSPCLGKALPGLLWSKAKIWWDISGGISERCTGLTSRLLLSWALASCCPYLCSLSPPAGLLGRGQTPETQRGQDEPVD